MTCNFIDVGLFHTKMRLDNVLENGVGPREWSDELIKYRIDFLQEELQEFIVGCELRDHAEMADALVDLVYVALGTAHFLGYPWEALWNEVQRANMTKQRALPDGSDAKRHTGLDTVKPEGWHPPEIQRVLAEHGWDGYAT